MIWADVFLFLTIGGGLVAVSGLLGYRVIRVFDFDRAKMWGTIADWASANEAAAAYRLAVRRERPWREWKEGVR